MVFKSNIGVPSLSLAGFLERLRIIISACHTPLLHQVGFKYTKLGYCPLNYRNNNTPPIMAAGGGEAEELITGLTLQIKHPS